MKLGAFSISLTVKNIQQSFDFYTHLGFEKVGGDIKQNWLIMKNENAIIGLFQGILDSNVLTFNPGWDERAEEVNPFQDIRDIQKKLLERGVSLAERADENTRGPAYITFTDPDGNKILIDQHR